MAVGIAVAEVNKMLGALCAVADYTKSTAIWIKLHTGDPGAAGTANAATETTRKQASFGSPSGGSIANTGALDWVTIAGSQDASHFTAWDDSAAGNFKFSGTITAASYTAGDTYHVDVGGLTCPMTVAS